MSTSTEPGGDVVKFLLPDGTEVSNDPRFYEAEFRAQILQQQNDRVVQATENIGHAGIPPEAQDALGVGGDSTRYNGRDLQPLVPAFGGPAEPAAAFDQQQADAADEPEDEDVSDEEKPYAERSASELQAEVKARKAAGRTIDTSGVRKKSELVELLEQDDAAQADESSEG